MNTSYCAHENSLFRLSFCSRRNNLLLLLLLLLSFSLSRLFPYGYEFHTPTSALTIKTDPTSITKPFISRTGKYQSSSYRREFGARVTPFV